MNDLLWPLSRAGEALAALASSTLLRGDAALAQVPAGPGDAALLGEWLDSAARRMGLEMQPVQTTYAELDRQLQALAPAIVRVHSDSGDGLLAMFPGRSLRALGPDLRPHLVPIADIHAALCSAIEAPLLAETERLLDNIEIAGSKRSAARDAILRERLAGKSIGEIWLLRLAPSSPFLRQLKQARVVRRLAALGIAHLSQYVLWILAWWVAGNSVLNHRAGSGWLLPWALLLLTLVPLRLWITWLQGLVAVSAGARLKQRLFFGALKMDPDSLRHKGVGQLLGSVIESEAVENLALSGGLLALVALVELIVSVFVLATGAGGPLQSVLLIGWLAFSSAIAAVTWRRAREWTGVRLNMTHELIENMVGHRTRVAQLPPEHWHDGEDEALEQYLKSSCALDRSTAALLAIAPRGWLIVALASLAPAITQGAGSAARIAVAVGGILLAYRALRRLASGASQMIGAVIAWERVGVLYHAATREETIGLPGAEHPPGSFAALDARQVAYRYGPELREVLHNCSLEIRTGDRLVLEGPSGGGKSTLVSLLVGMRQPTAGEILIDGCDRATLGDEGWRKRIAAAPQFHENHILAETFAFNLLMGKRRAPTLKD